MQLSPYLQKEQSFVEVTLGDSVICSRCKATLATYADCPAELSDPCPGFITIEGTRKKFREQPK